MQNITNIHAFLLAKVVFLFVNHNVANIISIPEKIRDPPPINIALAWLSWQIGLRTYFHYVVSNRCHSFYLYLKHFFMMAK